MNDNSVKLYKKGKFFCSCLCFVIVLSLFVISSSADVMYGSFSPRIEPVDPTIEIDGTYGNSGIITIPCLLEVYSPELPGHPIFSFNTLAIIYGLDGGHMEYTFALAESPDTINSGIPWFNYEEISVGSHTYDISMYLNDVSLEGFIDYPEGLSVFLDNVFIYEPSVPPYDGIPLVDILNGVMEALDVNIFGTFSYLDIVSTLAGACLAIWLLKMLAGG